MQISRAVSTIFGKTYPMIEGRSPLLIAGSLLWIHPMAMVVRRPDFILGVGGRNCLMLGGYHVLKALLTADPADYYKTLYSPCEGYALGQEFVSVEGGITEILRRFGETGFGFAPVEEPDTHLRGLVTVNDVVGLLESGAIWTDLSIREVATPIFSMPRDSALKDVLKEMFARHHRRVFVSGKQLSDRQILAGVLAPAKLKEIKDKPRKLLDLTLSDLGPTRCTKMQGNTSVKAACHTVTNEGCIVCEAGVVTSWDLVMKPWKMGRLRIPD